MLKIKLLAAFAFGVLGLQAQTTSEHGYRYVHHTQHEGPKPQRGEAMVANVDVYVDDFLLNSSKKNPGGVYRYEIPADNGQALTHYPPLMDAALLMSKGDSLTIYQSVDDNMRQYLPPAEKEAKEIRFEVVLLDIVTASQKAAANARIEAYVQALGQKVKAKAEAYRSGQLEGALIKSKTGLQIFIETKGDGTPVQSGEALNVHYYGCLTNGTPFENSFIRRQPLQFAAGTGSMIAGFDEGVLMLNHGSHAYLFVPPSLGYGDQEAASGSIPPNSELVFYVEIL